MPIDWEDAAAVARLLGPALAYHRSLATVAGGVNAGLLLSRALHLTRLESKQRPHGWICRSVADWTEELGLTRSEQEAARSCLARSGLWEEAIAGLPARRWVRMRLSELLVRLREPGGGAGRPRPEAPRPASQTAANPQSSMHRKGETSLRDSHTHVSTKAANKFHQNRQQVSTKPPSHI